MGSATVPVAVFGVAPKTLQPTDLSNDGSGATPEPAGATPALPPIVQPKIKKAASVPRGRLIPRWGHRAAMSGRRSAPTLPFHPAMVAETGSLHGPFWLRVFTHRIQYQTVIPACAPV